MSAGALLWKIEQKSNRAFACGKVTIRGKRHWYEALPQAVFVALSDDTAWIVRTNGDLYLQTGDGAGAARRRRRSGGPDVHVHAQTRPGVCRRNALAVAGYSGSPRDNLGQDSLRLFRAVQRPVPPDGPHVSLTPQCPGRRGSGSRSDIEPLLYSLRLGFQPDQSPASLYLFTPGSGENSEK